MVRKLKFRTAGKFRSRIAFTISTNQFHLPKNNREGLKPLKNNLLISVSLAETGIKDGFEVMKHEFPFGKVGLSFQMFRCSREFLVWTTQKVAFHLLSKRIFRKLSVNSKQPGTCLSKSRIGVYLWLFEKVAPVFIQPIITHNQSNLEVTLDSQWKVFFMGATQNLPMKFPFFKLIFSVMIISFS